MVLLDDNDWIAGSIVPAPPKRINLLKIERIQGLNWHQPRLNPCAFGVRTVEHPVFAGFVAQRTVIVGHLPQIDVERELRRQHGIEGVNALEVKMKVT
jgi:hypothetical protein